MGRADCAFRVKFKESRAFKHWQTRMGTTGRLMAPAADPPTGDTPVGHRSRTELQT
jgi:hypothetical protein